MKLIHTPDHKLYEQYYSNQTRRKEGSLPAYQGTRFKRGYGLGSIFRRLSRWATPFLKKSSKVLGKKALQTSLNVTQDVLEGQRLKTSTTKRFKEALGLPTQNSLQEQSTGDRKKEITFSTTFSFGQETKNNS